MSISKFIHLTDPHLVNPDLKLYGLDPLSRIRAAVDSLLADGHRDAEFMVITGDLTHWGDAPAYELLDAELTRLPFPVELVIGNHDDRETFLNQFPDAHRDPNGFIQGVRDFAGVRCLFLDTVLAGTHAGAYCGKRLQWLSYELERADVPVMLFMHHPPFEIGLPRMDSICLADHEAFSRIIAPFKHKVRHLFFGHVHRPISGSWRGIPFSTLYGTNHQVAFSLKDDPDLTGTHELPAYSVVLVDPDRVLVHTHSYLESSPRFSMASTQGVESRAYALEMSF